MAAYGLYTHIASNKFRSMLLLGGLFLLIYVLVYAGALIAEVLINGDGSVDITDLSLLSQYWGASGATWGEGDVNYDSSVDITDLSILSQYWGGSMPISTAMAELGWDSSTGTFSAVPEPGTLALAALGGASLLLFRRRK